ncbi:hypothetical protein [Saccharopolyspora phatthalungensis]|uniref:Uncharacterized protein n=1 Tax=Saccharopolyspora phatthalungensis TaxID=664693 RepID=A0A840QF45_9PSEU|nr:hypothetical protein [Saccharopolyspora phatthalungensis]MBB5157209.1 hypothetical protein [Saccharopolyspora phatthalungensis]
MTLARHAGAPQERGRFAEARASGQLQEAIQSGRAARTVADYAVNAQDCEELLAMLGLKAADGKRCGRAAGASAS